MKTGRLGCLSASGIIATLITLLILGGVGFARGSRMFNPGPLNAQAGAQPLGGVLSHAETGGRCSACHTAVWESETMSDRCLVCHQELITNPENFHKVMLAQSQTSACHECHTEHTGAQASLTLTGSKQLSTPGGWLLAGGAPKDRQRCGFHLRGLPWRADHSDGAGKMCGLPPADRARIHGGPPGRVWWGVSGLSRWRGHLRRSVRPQPTGFPAARGTC